jgi:hypothetical protein
MATSARGSGGGFELTLELDSGDLLPGRLVDGRLSVSAPRGGSFRGARVTLVGTERWRSDQTTVDAEGRSRTETRTEEQTLPKVPISVLGPMTLAPGARHDVPFQVPVPSLGPPTFEATELAVSWELRANLDIGGIDPSVDLPVRLLQPTSLLRAGVIDVAQFALFDEADVATDDLSGSIRLDPVPLCIGTPFRGELTITSGSSRRVQEIRLELRVVARSTVSGGREETITLWATRLEGPGEFGSGVRTYRFEDSLADLHVPTIRTSHGRADAAVHLIVATQWARDPHLIRDVALCSTTEL